MFVRTMGVLAAICLVGAVTATAQLQSIDICEAIDTSGSISDGQLELEIQGFKAALNAVLIPAVNAGRSIGIGVVGFSTNVQTFLSLRQINGVNRSEILNAYDRVTATSDRDLTNLGGAIQECVDVLSASTAERRVINLSTDGRPTTGPNTVDAANAAKDAGIELWTLGIGPDVDHDLLEQIVGCGTGNSGCGARNFQISSFQEFPPAISEKTGQIANGGDDGTPNRAPVAENDTIRTGVGTAVTIRVLDNDLDPDIDPLVIQSASTPSNGQVAIDPTATITYTPSSGFQGTDTFTYTISDGHGGTDTATVGIGVGVAPPDPGDDDGDDGDNGGGDDDDDGPPTGVPGLTPPWLALLGGGLLVLMGRELWLHTRVSDAN